MKVIALNGSPNKRGNTWHAMEIVTDELEAQDINVEKITIGDKKIQGCISCYGCKTIKRCALPDDGFAEIMEKILSADGLLLASPVYYGGIPGPFKGFLDRVFFSNYDGQMKYKVGASLVTLRRHGAISAFDQMNYYMLASEMLIVPAYWNTIFGTYPYSNFDEDKEGKWRLQRLGRNMAWLLKMKDYTKDIIALPRQDERMFTSFIR
jgi:multimeric flavodoxin WrbA